MNDLTNPFQDFLYGAQVPGDHLQIEFVTLSEACHGRHFHLALSVYVLCMHWCRCVHTYAGHPSQHRASSFDSYLG